MAGIPNAFLYLSPPGSIPPSCSCGGATGIGIGSGESETAPVRAIRSPILTHPPPSPKSLAAVPNLFSSQIFFGTRVRGTGTSDRIGDGGDGGFSSPEVLGFVRDRSAGSVVVISGACTTKIGGSNRRGLI